MRRWPILAFAGVLALVLGGSFLYAAPSFQRLCDGSLTGIPTDDVAASCARLAVGARAIAVGGGIVFLVALLLGAQQALFARAGRSRDRDARPIVSVHARKRP